MSASQIATSVTIISSLKGFQGISLTNYTTSALSAIAAGSVVEVGQAFFLWAGDETPNASSWTAIATASSAYLQCVPSGSAGSQILTSSWTTTAPTWREDWQGWYASAGSSTRIIGAVYKKSTTAQDTKFILGTFQNHLGKLQHLPLDNSTTRQILFAKVPPALGNWSSAFSAIGTGVPAGIKGIRASVLMFGASAAQGVTQLEMTFSDNNTNIPALASTAHPGIDVKGWANATAASAIGGSSELDIPVDTSGQFYMYTSAAVNVTIAGCAIYLSPIGFYMGD